MDRNAREVWSVLSSRGWAILRQGKGSHVVIHHPETGAQWAMTTRMNSDPRSGKNLLRDAARAESAARQRA